MDILNRALGFGKARPEETSMLYHKTLIFLAEYSGLKIRNLWDSGDLGGAGNFSAPRYYFPRIVDMVSL